MQNGYLSCACQAGKQYEGRRADRKGICERGSEAEAEADAADSLGGGGKDGGLGVGEEPKY